MPNVYDPLSEVRFSTTPNKRPERAWLHHSSQQRSDLRKVIHESEWAKKNILIAVAGGAGDGTSRHRRSHRAALTRYKRQVFLFLAAILVPATMLVGLASRILYQDRELAAKRAADQRHIAIDQLRRELEVTRSPPRESE
jgi:hypothetical protein